MDQVHPATRWLLLAACYDRSDYPVPRASFMSHAADLDRQTFVQVSQSFNHARRLLGAEESLAHFPSHRRGLNRARASPQVVTATCFPAKVLTWTNRVFQKHRRGRLLTSKNISREFFAFGGIERRCFVILGCNLRYFLRNDHNDQIS